MKKKIYLVTFIGWNFQQKTGETITASALAMANIEALANGEGDGYGTLYGSTDGSLFCCCTGSERTCSAALCPSSFCD